MRAFVTGGTGFIGSSVVRTLLERDVHVRALARPDSVRANLDGLDVEIVEGDLRDADSLRRGMAGCELVFHVGALYSFWVRPRSLIYEVNVDGTRALFEAAKACGVERVVYTSSVAALGLRDGPEPDGWREFHYTPGGEIECRVVHGAARTAREAEDYLRAEWPRFVDFLSWALAQGTYKPGDLNLSGLTSAEGLKLPESVVGGLDLSGLTSAEGLKLPESFGGWLYLSPKVRSEKSGMR